MQELNRRVQADLPLSAAEHSAWRQWIVAYAASSSSAAGKRRKRKKKRKRRLSHSSYGRVRRRKRQWHVPGWLAGFGAPHVMFLSVVVRLEMSGITSGMDQKDNGALIVDSGSGMCKARFPGISARYVFPLVVSRDQKHIYPVDWGRDPLWPIPFWPS